MRRRGKLSNKQWTLWTEMLISAWPISVMLLKCSGGIRVLTDSSLPCSSSASVTQMSSLGLRFMEADLQAASSCSNPRLDVFLPCTSSHSCPWGPLTQWMLQAHHLKRANASSCRSLHRLHTEWGTSPVCHCPPACRPALSALFPPKESLLLVSLEVMALTTFSSAVSI